MVNLVFSFWEIFHSFDLTKIGLEIWDNHLLFWAILGQIFNQTHGLCMIPAESGANLGVPVFKRF